MEHVLIRVIVELISWAAHLFQGKDEDGEEQRRGNPQPVFPPPKQPQDPSSMSDLNDFMRRMQQAQQPPPQAFPPQPLPPRRLVGGEPIEVEILDEPPTGRGVAAHVQQAINTRSIEERTSHLAEGVRSADEQMEARLHQKFDHKVGHLGGGAEDYSVTTSGMDSGPTGRAAAPPAATAEEIAAMLRDPASIRKMIVLNEIMKPAFERE